ncbi:thermonuclease family protein [Truepera radiovictrix]|uniref:Nuclease (SNase domain protein) n=1 Tax=Truepera radiovictrix (strain DSM 17093 / CIP 108686 / LMG 22925 / RQ-24) TaxID=649638 RepID=D7CT36_TRURR|nr:thermonuclease family protein [Truepera radiovictrix]ADI15499.1 nuclease (SNase domain protein) [Truepera radiovictrix DSM 17093]WMT55950.1 thermonuclease family protein [Truepera radiovictrix]
MPGSPQRGRRTPQGRRTSQGRRTVSPLLALLVLVAVGAATLFGERVPVLGDLAAYLSELVGAGPQVEGLMGPAEVVRVSDGDTVRISLDGQEENVRLIGVDTPEKHRGAKLTRDAESSPLSADEIQALGEQASAFTERLLAGGEVYVQPGTRERDRYGRLLAYLYVRDPEGAWEVGGERFTQVNLELVRAGWADPLTIPPNVEFADEYVAAAREARAAGRGMWAQGWVALAE